MAISVNSVKIKAMSLGHTTQFDPVAFWSGYNGGFWDFTNPSNLWANTARTTPATLDAAGGVLAVTDMSGLNNHLVEGSGSTSFTMRSGYCESYSGGLTTAPISIGTAFTALCLFRPTGIGTMQNLVDSDYGTSNRAAQNLIITATGYMRTYVFGYTTPSIVMPSPALSDGVDYFSAAATNATDTDLSVAGVTYTDGGGTPDGGLSAVAVGATYGGTLSPIYQQFIGRLYCAAFITKKCTPAEVAEIGAYMNSLAGTSATI